MPKLPDREVPEETASVAPEAAAFSAETAEATRAGRDWRREKTGQLFEQIAGIGDPVERGRLLEEVVILNMGVADAIARRYRDRGISAEDLTQVANVGLVKAVQGFDVAFGRDFLSYAVPTITGEVKRYFRDQGWTVCPPRRIQELQAQISQTHNELSQALQRAPRPSEIADHLSIDVEQLIEALCADGCFAPTSLDRPVGEAGTSTCLGELLGGEDGDLDRVEIRLLLGPVVRQLSIRHRRILELRFFHGWTQEEIAHDLGVTQMQVSRLLTQILHHLRSTLS